MFYAFSFGIIEEENLGMKRNSWGVGFWCRSSWILEKLFSH